MTRIALIVCMLTAFPAAAQTVCGPRENVISHLEGKYGETQSSSGFSESSRSIIEVYSNEETGTWTIIRSMPNGVSCLVDSGIGFAVSADEPKGDPI